VDRAEGVGDGMTARAGAASSEGSGPDGAEGRAGELVSDADCVAGAAGPVWDDATVPVPVLAGVAAVVSEAPAVGVPAPYIQVPVDCTAPGLSVMPETVTWCPWVSVSRTVNGPGPAPEAAIQ
jgi:hypothetical protein